MKRREKLSKATDNAFKRIIRWLDRRNLYVKWAIGVYPIIGILTMLIVIRQYMLDGYFNAPFKTWLKLTILVGTVSYSIGLVTERKQIIRHAKSLASKITIIATKIKQWYDRRRPHVKELIISLEISLITVWTLILVIGFYGFMGLMLIYMYFGFVAFCTIFIFGCYILVCEVIPTYRIKIKIWLNSNHTVKNHFGKGQRKTTEKNLFSPPFFYIQNYFILILFRKLR